MKNDLEGDEEEKVGVNPKSSMSTNANFSLIQESSNPESTQSSGYKYKIFNIFSNILIFIFNNKVNNINNMKICLININIYIINV